MKSLSKKMFPLVMAVLVVLVTACSNTPTLISSSTAAAPAPAAPGASEATPAPAPAKPALDKKYSFTVGTSSSGGSVYAIGAGLSNLLTDGIDNLDMRAIATGGAVDNVGLMGRKEVQFACNASNTNFLAFGGQLSGMDEQTNLRGILSLYPSVFHFIVGKKSGITDFDKLGGRKGAVGAPASATDLYCTDVLNYYGYDYKDRKDVEAVYANTTDATGLFKDGHIDWALFPLGVPGSAVLDLSLTGNVDMLPIAGADRDGMLEKYPYYVPYTIPGGTYSGFDNDIDTIGCVITFVADESVDEEVVYQVTKYIWENIDSVKNIAKGLDWMNKDTAMQGLGVPLHPGAERYYKEVGWL
jgi:TRAP transporter TAXI family solute receptor